jgi:hypothetical protein
VVDLGRPDTYADAQGVVELLPFEINTFINGPNNQFELLETTGEMLYRPRYFSIWGEGSGGTMGDFVVTFQGLYSGNSSRTWFPPSGGLVAAADRNVGRNESFLYTWNTEISDNYSNLDSDFGRIWVGGMPLMYMPSGTIFSVLLSKANGYDGDYILHTAQMQLERFQPERVTGSDTTTLDQVYLLPVNQ